MKKQLEIINRIESQKVELGMKVELSLMADLQKALNDLKEAPVVMNNNVRVFKQFQAQVNEAMKGYNYNKEQLTVNNQKYQNSFERTGKLLNDLQSSAQGLGINVNDIKGYSELQKLHQNLISSVSDLKKAISSVKF